MDLLRLFTLILVFTACQNGRLKLGGKPEPLSIMQGPTSQTETQINIVSHKSVHLSFAIYKGGTKIEAIHSEEKIKQDHSDYIVTTLLLNHLKASEDYRLVVSEDDEVLDERWFKTMPEKQDRFKVVVASCMSDVYKNIADQAWPQVFKLSPDALFLIGDNVYADVYAGIYTGLPATPVHLWNRHIDSRLKISLYHQKQLIPVYATWDDHDYGANDGTKHFVYREDSLKIFKTFFPHHKTTTYEPGLGVSGKLSIMNYQFYFLDNRYYRDSPFAKDGTHFGAEQENWLFDDLAKNSNPSVIISGDQFFGAYHNFESFEKHHHDNFQMFMKKLKKEDNRFMLLSGDRHLFELMRIKNVLNYPTYELTTSAIHAIVFEGALARDPNPRRIAGKEATYNWAYLEFKPAGKGISASLQGKNELGQNFFETQLNIK